jgi:hypothetical protein
MRTLPIILTLATLLLLGCGLYLVIQNRNSPTLREKAIPALIIGVVTALITIWFSLKNESIKTQFTSTVFINVKDKKPLEFHENRQFLFGGEQFDSKAQEYINKTIATRVNLTTDVNNVSEQAIEFYMDMLIVKAISHFFWMYADWWDVHIQSVRRGNSTITGLSANKPDPPFITITWDNWLNNLDSKYTQHSLLKEYSNDFWIQKMVVPPKTTVSLHSMKYERQVIFKNKFAYICINIKKRSGSRGLGDYQFLLGYDEKKNDSFWSEHFELTCSADFEKLLSGHPEMERYIQWVKTMFTEIEYKFDDSKRMERALEYKSLIKMSQ